MTSLLRPLPRSRTLWDSDTRRVGLAGSLQPGEAEALQSPRHILQ